MRASSKLVRTASTAFRVALMAALFSILGFALGGLGGIVILAALNAAGSPHNMQLALRAGALPGAALGLIAGLVMNSVFERRAKRAWYPH